MPPGRSNAGATRPTATVPLSTVFCADDADVVIRAAGARDFRVHKLILSLASPMFKDMLTLPQPASDTLPHVDVQESPEIWSNILHTIYPLPNPTIDNLGDLESLLRAAKKYEIQFIIDPHKKVFKNRELIKKDPLRLYAIACACGFEDEAKYVARNADTLTVARPQGDFALDGVPAATYSRLIAFLVQRDSELRPIFEEGWRSFKSQCLCLRRRSAGEGLYGKTEIKLAMQYVQMEEVYLSALEDRSFYDGGGCSGTDCAVSTGGINKFLKGMFAERERVCDKFMWKQ